MIFRRIFYLLFTFVACLFISNLYKNFVFQRHLDTFLKASLNKKVWAFGDSHVEANIDVENNNILNFGRWGEPIQFSYLKISYLIAHNIQKNMALPNTILLNLTPNLITPSSGSTSNRNMDEFVTNYYFTLNNRNYGKWCNIQTNYNLLALRVMRAFDFSTPPNVDFGFFINGFKQPLKDSLNLYKILVSNRSDSFCLKAEYLQDFNNGDSSIEYEQIKYIPLIKNLCEKYNIKFIIFHPPVHPKYYNYTPKNIKWKVDSILKEYSGLDYKDLYFDSIHYIRDANHLNYLGARAFTDRLLRDVINGF